jgi:CRP-like cAMP-binding protein
VEELNRKPCVQFPHVKYAAGETLFRQGDPADAIFYIGSGRLHRLITTERGDERLISILRARDFCGEESLTHRLYRSTSAVVVEDAEIFRIDKGLMPGLLRDSPDLAGAFTTFLLSHCLATESALVDQLFESVEQRLRRVLWKLANFEENGDKSRIVSGVRQQMLADMVGTTRPRVNTLLNKLRELGLIDYGGTRRNGDIVVHRRLRPPRGIYATSPS